MTSDIIPEAYRDLVGPDSKAIAYLATLMPDGSPIVNPIWFGMDGADMLIVTFATSVKARNMWARPQVAVVLQDPAVVYRYLQVRGPVIEGVVDPPRAAELINAFSWRYDGHAYEAEDTDDSIFRIRIERANGWTG
jgi:PPOX class probable F420-dependent enzyme